MLLRGIAGQCIVAAMVLGLAVPRASGHAAAQDEPSDVRTAPITGRQLGGFVLPVEPVDGPIRISARRAARWLVDDTNRLWISGDVEITIGDHVFTADEATVWINRLPSARGVINQIAVYFDHVDDPTRRAGYGVAGDDVLVTGSALGAVELTATTMNQGRPNRAIVRRGVLRLQTYLQTIVATTPRLRRLPHADIPEPEPDVLPVPGGRARDLPLDLPTEVELPPVEDQPLQLFEPRGIMRFTAAHIETPFAPGDDEDVVIATGSVVFEYVSRDRADAWSHLTMSAERAVVFTDPGMRDAVARGQFDADMVRGIYLEGNVLAATEGDAYQLRAPKVYYDVQQGRAIMLESVLRTYSRTLNVPVYARAREMRQVAQNEWDAEHASVSTSAFATPHLAIGARRVTVTQVDDQATDGSDDEETHIRARDVTLRLGGVPVLYWPRFSGQVEDVPLERLSFTQRRNRGFGVTSEWNVFALLDRPEPRGIEARLHLDGYIERGPAAGLELRYNRGDVRGVLDTYGIYDTGDEDRTNAGRDVARDEGGRGLALLEHQQDLARNWLLQAQVSCISDETFITTWRPESFTHRREYETSAYLKHQSVTDGGAALTAYVANELNDFISNDDILASRQRRIERQPEVAYRRVGDALFGGGVTYTGEISATRMRFLLEDHTPAELGVRQQGFGIGLNTPFSDALTAQGFTEDYVVRADTRHEFAVPFQWSIWNIAPFFSARATVYDNDFSEFSSDADDRRFLLGSGVRVRSQFQHIDDRVHSGLFDLHRLRHIVEPYMTLWYGYADVSNEDVPEYDWGIEGAGGGATVSLGFRNTWQTKRGGPGRWRDVDFLVIDTQIALNSSDANPRSPVPQFFDYRPEYSQFGDHAHVAGRWLVTDTMSFQGEATYALDDPQHGATFARSAIGTTLRHSPRFNSTVEYRSLNYADSELLILSWVYQMTPKYRIRLTPQWDFRESSFRALNFGVLRRFPDFELSVDVRYDDIRDETTVGASIGHVLF